MMLLLLAIACQNENKITENEVVTEDEQWFEEDDTSPEEQEQEVEEEFSCNELTLAEESMFIPQTGTVLGHRDACQIHWHASAGAKNSSVSITVESWSGEQPAVMRVENLLGEALVDWTEIESGQSLHASLAQSGEFFILLRAAEETEIGEDYQLGVDCVSGCELEYTRYPIVFLHGLAGFDSLLNVMDYWVGVEDIYATHGFHAEIHNVPAFDTTYVRVEEWKDILEELVEAGIGRRFNLIGHSQGGLDSRYLASLLDPDHRIVTVTTISTPHQGSAVAGALSGAMNGLPFDGALINAMMEMGANIFGVEGEDLAGQLEQMDPVHMIQFNEEVPDREDVHYFSWAGKSCRSLQFSCQFEQSGETVSSYFHLAHAYMELEEGDNDGLVSVNSAEWGTFLGVIPADHMDEVGHKFDLSTQPFNATLFYLEEARRLSIEGF